jgi:hypothetical protein
MAITAEQILTKLEEFEYSILSEYYIPNSKNKTQVRISKRMDEILVKLELNKKKK